MKFERKRALAASVSAAWLATPAFAREIWGHPPVVHVRLRRGAVARDDQPRQCVVPC